MSSGAQEAGQGITTRADRWSVREAELALFDSERMREADRRAAESGVPTILLMEAAGRAVAEACRRHFPAAERVLLLCGKGNNGGDGLAAARQLLILGARPRVLTLGKPTGADSQVMLAALRAHLKVEELDLGSLDAALGGADLVVDALLGSGLSRPLEGQLAHLVDLINGCGKPVLAIDVPTGVDADRAVPPGQCVRATVTVQLAAPKVASVFEPARQAYGEQEVADIGIPDRLLLAGRVARILTTRALPGLPEREPDAHKYQVGTVLVVAGSSRYPGAAELACRGAYRAGAGLVTLASTHRVAGGWPEIVFESVPERDGLLGLIGEESKRARAVVAGPGLAAELARQLPQLLEAWRQPFVLDAGALLPSEEMRAAVATHGKCVLTPHAGEAARLLGVTASEITGDPLAAAARLAGTWRAVVVLKGSSTVIADPDGSLAVSRFGHPGMATGGTGDVLAGVIGAFVSTGLTTERVEAAVAVHGRAGELAGRDRGIGLLASDVVERLPASLAEAARAS